MLLQIIYRNVEWFQFIINGLIVAFARFLDIISTRYVTKDLKLETNKLAKRLGWKGMILIQLPVIILGSLDFYLAFFILVWSLFLFANNMEGSWYVKEKGESAYYEELKESINNSKNWRIILGETSALLTFTFSGLFILIFLFIFNDYIAVFFICLALICQGSLISMRSLSYLLDLKREKPSKKRGLKEKIVNKEDEKTPPQ